MPSYLKQYIARKLKENVPLGDIRQDLKEKGYGAEEVNKTIREAIAGVNKSSNVTIMQMGILVVGLIIAIGVAIYVTSQRNGGIESSGLSQEELIVLKQAVGFSSSQLQGTSECNKFIPSSLLDLQLQNYSTNYSIDGSKNNSVWKSSSEPPKSFSLNNLPELFYVYQQGKFIGCGYIQNITTEKSKLFEGNIYKCGGIDFKIKKQNLDKFEIIGMLNNLRLRNFIVYNDTASSLSEMGCVNE